MTCSPLPPWRGDDGFAPAEFVLAVGLWLFPLTLLVVSLPMWVERLSLARVGAQEAARIVVLADTQENGVAAAERLVAQIAENHGIPMADLQLQIEGRLRRGEFVTAEVRVRVPALALPVFGDRAAFTVTSSHSEPVDRYRGFDP